MAGAGQRILTQLGVRMVLAVLVAGGAAAYFTLKLDNTYRARTLLILAPMPMEQKDEVPGLMSGSNETPQRISFVKTELLEPLPMPDYKILLTSEELAGKIRDALLKSYQEAGIDPGNLTIEKVSRAMEIRSKVHIQTQEEVQYQQVVELLFTAKDPKIAAAMCNEWARLGIEMAERMRLIAREGAVEFFTDQLAGMTSALNENTAKLETLESKFNADTLKQRLSDLESAITSRQLRRAQLTSDIARIEAEVAQWDTEIASMDAASTPHAELTQRRASALGELAGMRAENAAIEQEAPQIENTAAAARADLARTARERSDYEAQIGVLRKQVDELTMTLQAAKMSAADTEPAFKIAVPATKPEEKVAPQRSLIVLVAMFLAGVAIPVHLFGMEALRRYARNLEAGTMTGQ